MATIKEFENKMTLFYSRQTGKITTLCFGIQDMSFYGEDIEDYSIIYDYIVVDKDEYVINNIEKFMIEEGKVVLKPEEMNVLSKYIK